MMVKELKKGKRGGSKAFCIKEVVRNVDVWLIWLLFLRGEGRTGIVTGPI